LSEVEGDSNEHVMLVEFWPWVVCRDDQLWTFDDQRSCLLNGTPSSILNCASVHNAHDQTLYFVICYHIIVVLLVVKIHLPGKCNI